MQSRKRIVVYYGPPIKKEPVRVGNYETGMLLSSSPHRQPQSLRRFDIAMDGVMYKQKVLWFPMSFSAHCVLQEESVVNYGVVSLRTAVQGLDSAP